MIKISRRHYPLIIGAVSGTIAVFLISNYLQKQRELTEEAARQALREARKHDTQVLIAARNIPSGTIIRKHMVDTKILPRKHLEPQAVSSYAEIKGAKAIVNIVEGEQITLNKLFIPKKTLSQLIPEGKRAITVSVDNISSIIKMIKPGDYVDVIAIMPTPSLGADGKEAVQNNSFSLFQNVLVLAVGEKILQEKKPPEAKKGFAEKLFGGAEVSEEEGVEGPPTVTLALSPEEASILSFVEESGKIRLVLRSNLDTQEKTLPPVSWQTFFQYLISKGIITPPKVQPPPPQRKIQVYHGTKKEEVTISP